MSQSAHRNFNSYCKKLYNNSLITKESKEKKEKQSESQLPFNAIKIVMSHLVANDQFCTNCFYITASTNQKWDVFSCDPKRRGSKCSLGTISLSCSRSYGFGGSVLISSYPPVSLLVGRLSSASSWVITIGGLVVKCCTIPCPSMDAMFKVKLASF